ncbi:MAG: hypothetical protein Q9169_003945 [Polycauliona sp. 2 TL-2023]
MDQTRTPKRARRTKAKDKPKGLTEPDRAIPTPTGDTTEEEGPPAKKTRLPREYRSIERTGHHLRPRRTPGSPTDSPYLTPWQRSKLQQRRSRAGVTTQPAMSATKVASVSNGPLMPSRTPLPETLEDTRRRMAMLLRVGRLVGQNDIPCSSPNCPVQHPHGEGLYRFEGQVRNSELANTYFDPSIPPPAVVEAFNNGIHHMPSLEERNIKELFYAYHTLPCHPSQHLNKVSAQPCTSTRCGVEGPHNKGAYLQGDFDASLHEARRSDHVFGISNPPPEIWEAALRVVDGDATERDRELVDDFSAHHVVLHVGHPDSAEFRAWQEEWRAMRP